MTWHPDKPIHTVWVLRGFAPPRAMEAQLKITEKQVMCVLRNGQQKLFNSTAFFTELAAMRRYLGLLDKAAHDSYTIRHSSASDRILQHRPPNVYYGKRYFDPEEVAARLKGSTSRRP